MSSTNLKTVAAFASDTPFTEHQLRWWIFNADNNGLHEAGGLVRVGRRVYIDIKGFDRWVQAQNMRAEAA